MAEPILTTGTIIKGGTMVATGGSLASLVIFQDPFYKDLALTGAIVSMLGVLHEVFGEHTKKYTIPEIIVEVLKGLALGVLAIPFWYLAITEGVVLNLLGITVGQVSNSLSLIVSFALSWYTIPIFNSMVAIVKAFGTTLLKKWRG